MKKLLILLVNTLTFAQSQSYLPIQIDSKSAPYDVFVGTDEYDNPYFIKDNIFVKQSASQVYEYKNLSLGAIDKIDLNNPLKIVVFYRDFNNVVILDNQLNEINKISLSDIKTPVYPTAIGIAAQNRLWIYDSLSQKIGFFDYLNSNYLEITPSLSTTIKNYDSDFNNFRWIDDKNRLNTCDAFGKITNNFISQTFDNIKIIENQRAIIQKNEVLKLLDLKNGIQKDIKINEKTIQNFSYKNQILTIFTDQKISRYKINLE